MAELAGRDNFASHGPTKEKWVFIYKITGVKPGQYTVMIKLYRVQRSELIVFYS